MIKQVLFLCTGNYFRSRFAEELFNDTAVRQGLDWRADSRGLRQKMSTLRNEGAISVHTLDALKDLGIQPLQRNRWPLSVNLRDFQHATRVVAMCRREHEPMMRELFPMHAEKIEYWDIEDVHIWEPDRALKQLKTNVDVLLAEFQSVQIT